MNTIGAEEVRGFLRAVGQRYQKPATIYLLGGSALCLIGGTRSTVDIDYVGDDVNKTDLQRVMDQVALEFGVEVEAVPIDQFIPMPIATTERHLLVGQFGQIDVYVLDPYAIALSKLDRGFDTDIDDIVFLVQQKLVTMPELGEVVAAAIKRAYGYDLSPSTIQTTLQIVNERLIDQ